MSDADDNSNDVVMVEFTEQEPSDKHEEDDRPLMQLLQRLISKDNKQNTLLTNIQIISILKKEFDIDVAPLHDLEVDIYLNVVKKFLKDWPKWDEFDQGINLLKKQKAHCSIQQALEKKYKDLKEYLKVMMDTARPIAHEAVMKMLDEHAKRMESVDTKSVVLDVFCTRQQFNELILSQPNKENDIFNCVEYQPTNISIIEIPLESILNYWKLQIKIELKFFSYNRLAVHHLKHVLVNRKNGERNIKQILNENVQIKDTKTNTGSKSITRQNLAHIFQGIISELPDLETHQFFETVFATIMSDFNGMDTIKVPGAYRQHCNKYPYYRKLCKEQRSVSSIPHDLYIEETISPLIQYSILKADTSNNNQSLPKLELPPKFNWITLTCCDCRATFTDNEIFQITEHFKTIHKYEKDWYCTNCDKSFSMVYLTQNRWHHDCDT